jgi:hypothetical protein
MDGSFMPEQSGLNDYAHAWLQCQKRMRTYESAAAIGEWGIALDAAAEIRHLAIQLFLYAQAKVDGTPRA